jgi:hypothetical protein
MSCEVVLVDAEDVDECVVHVVYRLGAELEAVDDPTTKTPSRWNCKKEGKMDDIHDLMALTTQDL